MDALIVAAAYRMCAGQADRSDRKSLAMWNEAAYPWQVAYPKVVAEHIVRRAQAEVARETLGRTGGESSPIFVLNLATGEVRGWWHKQKATPTTRRRGKAVRFALSHQDMVVEPMLFEGHGRVKNHLKRNDPHGDNCSHHTGAKQQGKARKARKEARVLKAAQIW